MSAGAVELTVAPVVAGLAVLAVGALLTVWLVPRRQARRWKDQGVAGKDLADVENSARGTLVQLLGGAALVLTFGATWIQITDTREATDRTLELTRAQQETERFTRAVEQLGSSRLEVRIGGIYGLQQVARDSPRRRDAVAELMQAYLKTNHRVRRRDPRIRPLLLRNAVARRGARVAPVCETTVAYPAPDAQAAVEALLEQHRGDRSALDLAGTSLIGVRLPAADLSGADLRDASLAGAHLRGARFDGAKIYQTDLRRACLRNARFGRAIFSFPQAEGADFKGAELARATDAGTIRRGP